MRSKTIDFEVRAGEVLGLAGLIGAGRTEAMRAIFGADVRDTGTVVKRGKPLRIRSPRDGIAAGIAYLPEDRKEQGLILSLSGTENIVMASLERHGRLGLLSWPQMRQAAREVATNLQFRGQLGDPRARASGGNQQKLVIGKWVLTGAEILIFDEPTRGIDIAAKAEVYRSDPRARGRGRRDHPGVVGAAGTDERLPPHSRDVRRTHLRRARPGGIFRAAHPRRRIRGAHGRRARGYGCRSGCIMMLQPPQQRAPSTEEVRDRRLDRLRHYGRQVGLPLVVAALIGLFTATSDVFFSVQNFRNIGVAAAALAAVSFGQTFTILTAGLDLSVGSTVALVSIVGAFAMRNYGVGPGVLAALACGAAAGSSTDW